MNSESAIPFEAQIIWPDHLWVQSAEELNDDMADNNGAGYTATTAEGLHYYWESVTRRWKRLVIDMTAGAGVCTAPKYNAAIIDEAVNEAIKKGESTFSHKGYSFILKRDDESEWSKKMKKEIAEKEDALKN